MTHSLLQSLVFVFTLLFLSCNGNNQVLQDELNNNVTPCFLPFNNFPDSLFYSINWHSSNKAAQNNLELNGYQVIDSSGSFRYINSSDSIEVLLYNSDLISQFKVVMFSQSALLNYDELIEILSQKSISSDKAERFQVVQHNNFKIQIVNNDNSIQINFEENIKH